MKSKLTKFREAAYRLSHRCPEPWSQYDIDHTFSAEIQMDGSIYLSVTDEQDGEVVAENGIVMPYKVAASFYKWIHSICEGD